MTREFTARYLRQISSPYKMVLCVGSLFSEEYNTIMRLDALYVTQRSWLESTEPRDIGSNLNLHFEKFGFVFTARLRSYGLVLQLSF